MAPFMIAMCNHIDIMYRHKTSIRFINFIEKATRELLIGFRVRLYLIVFDI